MNRSILLLNTIVLLFLTGQSVADLPGWKIIQLAIGSSNPQISGSNIVWAASGGIYFWNGTTTLLIPDSTTGGNPEVSGSNVAWIGWDGNDFEIFFWDGTTITQVTDNDYDDGYFSDGIEDFLLSVQVSGSNLTWLGCPVTDDIAEIFFWDSNTITQITHNSLYNSHPQISGTNVVWAGYPTSNNWGIFLWNGTTTTKIPDSNDGYRPRISGSNVVWMGGSSGRDIVFWDGATTTQITNNSYNDDSPEISGSNVAWMGLNGSDWEIFFWDGATTTQVTDNNDSDMYPKISGSNVIWRGDLAPGGGNELFFWDGTATTQLGSRCVYPLFQISGSSVVWYHSDDARIMVAIKLPI